MKKYVLLGIVLIAVIAIGVGCLQSKEKSVKREGTVVSAYPEKPEGVVKKFYIGLVNKRDPEVLYKYYTKECIEEGEKEAKEEGYENMGDRMETFLKRDADMFIESIVIEDVVIIEKENIAGVDIRIYFSEEDPSTGERRKDTQSFELVKENGKWKIEC